MIRMLTTFLALIMAAIAQPYDVLVIVLDDIGNDQMFYNTHPDAVIAPMPNIESLASQGVRLTGCRSQAICSPSRGCLLTGRFRYRTGINSNASELGESEYTYADDLESRGYATALFGKWGLGDSAGEDAPRTRGGFGHFSGLSPVGDLFPADYYSYNKTTNGAAAVPVTDYITTETTDDAIAWIGAQAGSWSATVWYHAPHSTNNTYWQWPPAGLVTSTDDGTTGVNAYHACIEAVDHEIGRLIAAVDLQTTIVLLIGDNGSAFINPPNALGSKNTIYDDCRRVPFIAAGAGVTVSGAVRSELVRFVDLYPTIMQAAGGWGTSSPNTLDGKDFSGMFRGEVIDGNRVDYSWNGLNGGTTMVNDGTFRLVEYGNATPDLLFDLADDPHEQSNLGVSSLTGQAQRHYKNLLYDITTRTAKTEEQPVVQRRFSVPAVASGGLYVTSGDVQSAAVTADSAIITAPLKTGATDYTLWKRVNPFAAWENSGIAEVVTSVVTFTDPSPTGVTEYRITNNAPEP